MFIKRISLILSVIFTSSQILVFDPSAAVGQEPHVYQSTREDYQRLSEKIHLLSDAVLKKLSDQNRKDLSQNKSAKKNPAMASGKYCADCHETKTEPNVLEEKEENSAPSESEKKEVTADQAAPEQLESLTQLLSEFKLEIQKKILTASSFLFEQMDLVQLYFNTLQKAITVFLTLAPEKLPLDSLNETYALTLTEQKVLEIKEYLSQPEALSSTRDFFATAVIFDHNRLLFTEAFKTHVDLLSMITVCSEKSWLNYLKLQVLQYLSKELLTISRYWPQGASLNETFFSDIQKEFPFMTRNLLTLYGLTKNAEAKSFNHLFAYYMAERDIPPILTKENYALLIDRTKTLNHSLGDLRAAYIDKLEFSENEKLYVKRYLENHLRHYAESFRKMRKSDLAILVHKTILEAKSDFLKKYLRYHFKDEFHEDTAQELHDTLYSDYQRSLDLYAVYEWIQIFESPESDLQFLNLALLEIPKAMTAFLAMDRDIESVLLHGFHQKLAWKEGMSKLAGAPTYYSLDPLGMEWIDAGLDEEKPKFIKPNAFNANQNAPALLPSHQFPTFPVIENNPVNQSVLNAVLLDPVLKKISSFSIQKTFLAADSKQKLFDAFQKTVGALRSKIQSPAPYVNELEVLPHDTIPYGDINSRLYVPTQRARWAKHELKHLQSDLSALESLEGKIHHTHLADEATLEEFFETDQERLQFLKTKHSMILNFNRPLAFPFEAQSTKRIGSENFSTATLYQHLKNLQTQDGFLWEELLIFLQENERRLQNAHEALRQMVPLSIPHLEHHPIFDRSHFETQFNQKVEEWIGPRLTESTHQALTQNRQIIEKLRTLEEDIADHAVHLPKLAYVHPEYFRESRPGLIPDIFLEKLSEIQALREQRKKVYLEKGGQKLDEWVTTYVSMHLIRQMLIHKDLLIRKQIYKVLAAKDLEEIKELALDPFIFRQAMEQLPKATLEEESWRLESYTHMVEEARKNLDTNILESYFESSAHNALFWSLCATTLLVFLFVPGGQPISYYIGVALLADFGVQTGVQAHQAFWEIPQDCENRREFIHSTVSLSEEGPSNLEDIDILEDALFWKQAWTVGSASLLFMPWAAAEVRRGIRLFHESNLFILPRATAYAQKTKLPVHALSLPTIENYVYRQTSISGSTLAALSMKEFIHRASTSVGKREAQKLWFMLQFFRRPVVTAYLELQRLETFRSAIQTLGVEPIATLESAKIQTQALMEVYQKMLQTSDRPTVIKPFVTTRLRELEEGLATFEAFFSAKFYLAPELLLRSLRLSLETLPSRTGFEAWRATLATTPDIQAAAQFLETLYALTPSQKIHKWLELQILAQTTPHRAALENLAEILMKIPGA